MQLGQQGDTQGYTMTGLSSQDSNLLEATMSNYIHLLLKLHIVHHLKYGNVFEEELARIKTEAFKPITEAIR
jgi:hypothetical protein